MPLSPPRFVTAALAGALILGSLSACGVTPEAEEEMEKASVSAKIDTVIVTPDPCIGCAEARIAAGASRERAMQQAAAEAEARARRERDAQIARINGCVSQRARDLKVCNDTFTRAGQGMAADKAACGQRAALGCSTGNVAAQTATCVGNMTYVSEEGRRSCIDEIPITAPEAGRAQAAGRCFSVEALDNLNGVRFCNGLFNYNGTGSLKAICTLAGEWNCNSTWAAANAQQDANRVACISTKESQFLDCLLPGV